MEIDTIHLYNPISKTKRYIYTVIDVYSRMTYAKAYDEIRPGLALKTILEAQEYIGVKFKTVQSDNGSEFSSSGQFFVRSVGLATLNQQIAKYLDYYNYKRIHLGISYRTPSEMLQRL